MGQIRLSHAASKCVQVRPRFCPLPLTDDCIACASNGGATKMRHINWSACDSREELTRWTVRGLDVKKERAYLLTGISLVLCGKSRIRHIASRLPSSCRTYKRIRPYWRCSIQAMIRRIKDLGYIGEGDYRRLNISISRRKWRKIEPFDLDAPEERPALARKCLAVIQTSFAKSEDAFYNETCLPMDFGREIFGDTYRNKNIHTTTVLDFASLLDDTK